MKLKNLKGVIASLVVLFMIPLVSASIHDFLADMDANPNNYYIWHVTSESGYVSRVQSFANQFGVQVSNSQISGRNYLAVYYYGDTLARNNFGDWSLSSFKYVDGNLRVYIRAEDDYLKSITQSEIDLIDLNSDGNLSEYEAMYHYLDVGLDYLSNYGNIPDYETLVQIIDGKIYEDYPTPPCSDFAAFDKDIYEKDEYVENGFLWRDFCFGDQLSELTCSGAGSNLFFDIIDCPNGCYDGECVQGGCVPSCAGKVCGNDGCGGSCGTCSTGYTCSDGQCQSGGGATIMDVLNAISSYKSGTMTILDLLGVIESYKQGL